MRVNPRFLSLFYAQYHVDLRAPKTSRISVAYDRLAWSHFRKPHCQRRRRTYPLLGQVRTAARPLTREPGPADACVMQGHGRTDHETPVHLAYRIRQEWTDLGNLTVGLGYDAGDRRTVCILGSDERLTAFDVLQISLVHTVVDWAR